MAESRTDYTFDQQRTAGRESMGTGSGLDASLEDAARGMTRKAGELRDQAESAARDVKSYVEESLRTQPMMTLTVVSAIGFVLGALRKR